MESVGGALPEHVRTSNASRNRMTDPSNGLATLSASHRTQMIVKKEGQPD